MSAPQVSVLMPAHNAAPTIAEAIESVLAQTVADWELIIVDDGSADGTADIARRYADPRIRLLRQPRQGVAAARNRAAAESRGALLAFLDADDRFSPEKLAVQAALLASRVEVGSVYCAHRRVDAAGLPWSLQAPPWEVGFRDLLLGFPFNPSAQMLRRQWHETIGGFRPGLELHEDRDYWLRQIQAGCVFVRAPGVLADYRLGPPRRYADPGEKVEQALDVLRRALESDHGRALAPAERARARFEIVREWAFQSALSGRSEEAAERFQELLRLQPRLAEDRDPRDDFLQAAVDVSVRTRGDHEPILRTIFGELPEALAALRGYERWAAGCGAVQQGARELLWDRRAAARERFERARALGGGLDARTCRLLRHELLSYQGAAPEGSLGTVLQRLTPELAALSSPSEAAAFRDSLERPARPASPPRRALDRLTGLLRRRRR